MSFIHITINFIFVSESILEAEVSQNYLNNSATGFDINSSIIYYLKVGMDLHNIMKFDCDLNDNVYITSKYIDFIIL